MATIVPRWEWRTFGHHFGGAEAKFAALTPTGVQESEELYFLGGGEANVKVRDDLLDIKVLRQVDADGLECWEPVMKQGFPFAAADVARAFALLGLESPALARGVYTLAQFLDEVVAPGGVLRPVTVRKRRVRYVVNGCTAEVSEVDADGHAGRTIAIESEDAAAVVGGVAEVGLAGYLNTNYRVGLQDLVDDIPDRFAVIDTGTNSVKFHVAEMGEGAALRPLVDRAEMTRLGEGLADGGAILPAAAERTAEAIAGMVAEARAMHVRAIFAVGTAGLRIAANGAAIVALIHQRAGVSVEVISGAEETRLAFLAAQAGLGMAHGSLVVFDTGGGSTQFTFGHDGQVDEQFSVDVGAVRLTETFGLANAVAPEVVDQVRAAIAAEFGRIDGRDPPDSLVAMGGAVTNMAAVRHGLASYDPDVVQGTLLDVAEIDRQIELYRTRDAEARRAIVGLQPKRAEVILAGACVVRTVMDKLGQAALTVSDRGLRHGVLAQRLGG